MGFFILRLDSRRVWMATGAGPEGGVVTIVVAVAGSTDSVAGFSGNVVRRIFLHGVLAVCWSRDTGDRAVSLSCLICLFTLVS